MGSRRRQGVPTLASQLAWGTGSSQGDKGTATKAMASNPAMGRHPVLGGISSSSQAMRRQGTGSNSSSSRAAIMERLPDHTMLAASMAGHRALSLRAVASSRGTTPAYIDRLVISTHGHSKTWGSPCHFSALHFLCVLFAPCSDFITFDMNELVSHRQVTSVVLCYWHCVHRQTHLALSQWV